MGLPLADDVALRRADGSGRRAKLLILGGTAEAVALAGACASRPGLAVISSLAGRTQHPDLPPGDVRIGGFSGAAACCPISPRARGASIACSIPRTHSPAHRSARMPSMPAERPACARALLLRPPWVSVAGDRWTEGRQHRRGGAAPARARASRLPDPREPRARAFAQLDIWFLVLTIETPGVLPLPQGQWLAGRGPFPSRTSSPLRTHAIDVLVTKASGGGATYAKLVAARRAGLPVLMVRPAATAARPGRGLGCGRARLARRLYLGAPPAGRDVVVIGGIETAVRESRGFQGAADQDQRGACDALTAQLGADRSQRATDDALVRPGCAVDNDRWAVGAAHRRQLPADPRQVVDGQLNRERRAGGGQTRPGSRPAWGRRAPRCASAPPTVRRPVTSAPARAPPPQRRTPARRG